MRWFTDGSHYWIENGVIGRNSTENASENGRIGKLPENYLIVVVNHVQDLRSDFWQILIENGHIKDGSKNWFSVTEALKICFSQTFWLPFEIRPLNKTKSENVGLLF